MTLLTVREQVRLLMADTATTLIFTDDEVDVFLSLTGSEVLLAAAMGLDTMAASNALVLKKITLMGTQTDGPAVADALRALATSLREQHKLLDADGGMAFGTAEFADDHLQRRERIIKQMLRHP